MSSVDEGIAILKALSREAKDQAQRRAARQARATTPVVIKKDVETTRGAPVQSAPPSNNVTTAWEMIRSVAKRLRGIELSLSESESIAKAVQTPEGALWYDSYRQAVRRGERIMGHEPPSPVRKAAAVLPILVKIEALAKEKVRKGEATYEAEAVVMVVDEDRDLYAQYKAERRAAL
jgi:hypothetical protein